MKRLAVKLLATAAGIVLAGMAAAVTVVVWAAATEGGSRWLLTTAAHLGGGGFSVQKVEGRIADHLRLTEVRVGPAGLKAEFGTIELRWKPLLLLAGTVAVQELVIDRVRIQDDTPPGDKPPVLAWPRVSGNAQLFDGAIARLQVTDISYRRLQEQPLQVTSIAGSATWQDGLLSISNLKAESPSGLINGSVSAGLGYSFLTADLAVALSRPVAGMDRFSLQVRSGSAPPAEQIAGEITVSGSAGMRKLLELGGDVGMTGDGFNLRRLTLTRPGQRGVVTADGSLVLTPREPVLTMRIKAAGLDLAPELNVPTNLSGVLTFAGTPDNYRGGLTLANRAEGWQKATLSAVYHGTREGMKLAPLNAGVLDGTLAGNVDMEWRDGLAMRGTISGRNLNPARVDPGWKGVANFNATGKLSWTENAPVTGSVSGVLMESRLHGQALTGGVQAAFARGTISISRLELQGKGFDLHASGVLDRRLDLSAQVGDLSMLLPGSAGKFQGEGWVRWRDRHLSGAVTVTGSELAYGGTHIGTADLTARLDHGSGYPMHLTASLRDAVYNGHTLDAVTVAADGTLFRHTANASLRSAGATAEMTVTAGYSAGRWSGNVTGLSGGNGSGPWNLESPAAFAVGAGKFSLSPLTLSSGAAERLEAAADLSLKPLTGQVRVKWDGLNLARANPHLKDEQVTGSSHGSVRVDFLPGKRIVVAGSAAGSGIFTKQGHSIMFEESSVTFDGDLNGMKADVEIREATGGRLKGTFSSPAPLRLAMPENGKVTAEFSGIDLALFKPWLPVDTGVTGLISGRASGSLLPGKRLDVAVSAAGSGIFTKQGHSITFEQSSVTFDGDHNGMKAGIEIREAAGGRLKVTFSSPAPLGLAMPENGKVTAEFSGIDLALLKPWLPADFRVTGTASGRADGSMLPGKRFELDGTASLSGGTVHQEGVEGGLNLTVSSAESSWMWRGEALSGTVSLTMGDYGQARGNFQLPVPARIPVAANPKGPFQAKLIGQFREKGIITALFPGSVRETTGEIDTELSVGGTWEEPQFGGKLSVTGGGAYLPAAGIRLKDIQLSAHLDKNLILIDSFRALSGSGHIEGTALLTLAGWKVTGYQGAIRGENFQTVYFPELLIVSTPNLTFEGTPQKLKVRGELKLPELRLHGAPAGTVIAPSSDVVMEGIIAPTAKSSPLALDVQVRVLPGEKVFIKVAGIDAQLGGAVNLSLSSLDRITSSGEINVVKGRYRTYGVDLNIVRGRLFFSGGPVHNPALDFLALRTVGDVRAGVTVTGSLLKPVTRLYSEPAMPDVDVLAYIVLGHPIGSSGEQAGLMAQAAGALLTSSQASVVQDQIKSHLGLSTLEIQGGVGGSTSPMGYKPLQVTAPGTIPAAAQAGITETMLTVGKYLTPQLYISYGRSLFTGSNLFLLRYDIFRKWQIETQTGNESGADLFYKLEFK